MALRAAGVRRAPWFVAALLLCTVTAGCGARAQEPSGDPGAERVTQLIEQRDALARRVSVLEREVQLLEMQPTAQSAAPRAHVRPTVIRRWVGQLSSDADELILQLCVRSFELDQVFGGQPVFFTSDLCGEVRSSLAQADPAISIPSLLANEQFACWMLAAPERALPDCFRQFARVQLQ